MSIGHEESPMSIQPSSSLLERRHASTHRPVFVTIPERRFFAIDGIGRPSASDFRLATAALRTAAGGLCTMLHRERITGVLRASILECCWWPSAQVSLAELPRAFEDRATWHWRQLIELPMAAGDDIAQAAINEAHRRSGRDAVLIRPWSFREGPVGQLLNVGGYDGEPAVVGRLLTAIDDEGFVPAGPLHVLHIADSERVPAGRGRAIVRQPIAPARDPAPPGSGPNL